MGRVPIIGLEGWRRLPKEMMAMSSPEEYVLQRWSANMMLQKLSKRESEPSVFEKQREIENG